MPIGSARWGGIRPEPYKPDPVDADNDGIVQEGTLFERPAGTRLISLLTGLELELDTVINGIQDLSTTRLVDQEGREVRYSQSWRTGTPSAGEQNGTIGGKLPTIGATFGTLTGPPDTPKRKPVLLRSTDVDKNGKPLRVFVSDDRRFHGVMPTDWAGFDNPAWREAGAHWGGSLRDGEMPISADDPRLPDTLFYVTPNPSAQRDLGVVRTDGDRVDLFYSRDDADAALAAARVDDPGAGIISLDTDNIRTGAAVTLRDGRVSVFGDVRLDADSAPEPVRREADIPTPESLNPIKDRFDAEGFELYLVGGAVRDTLMGREIKDYDLATNATPDEVQAMLADVDGARLDLTGKDFAVVRVTMPDGEEYEIATFRRDVGEGRRPGEVELTTIDEDVRRRDLTMNALFYDLSTNEIVDYVGGIDDIENGVVRAVGDPGERFREDPLRILRAFRFSGRTGWGMDSATVDAIRANSKLRGVSGERVHDEFIRGIDSAVSPSGYIQQIDLVDNGTGAVWGQVFPGLTVSPERLPADGLYGNRAVLLASLLSDNDIDDVKAVLKDRKFTNDEIADVELILQARRINDGNVATLKNKFGKNRRVSADDMRAFHRTQPDTEDDIEPFLEFADAPPALTANDLAARGIKPGPQFGEMLREAEEQRYREIRDGFSVDNPGHDEGEAPPLPDIPDKLFVGSSNEKNVRQSPDEVRAHMESAGFGMTDYDDGKTLGVLRGDIDDPYDDRLFFTIEEGPDGGSTIRRLTVGEVGSSELVQAEVRDRTEKWREGVVKRGRAWHAVRDYDNDYGRRLQLLGDDEPNPAQPVAETVDSIRNEGLTPRTVSRVDNNAGIGDAVFLSESRSDINRFADPHIDADGNEQPTALLEIDLRRALDDEAIDAEDLSPEPFLFEGEAVRDLAERLGGSVFAVDATYDVPGVSEQSIVLTKPIPNDYISINGRNIRDVGLRDLKPERPAERSRSSRPDRPPPPRASENINRDAKSFKDADEQIDELARVSPEVASTPSEVQQRLAPKEGEEQYGFAWVSPDVLARHKTEAIGHRDQLQGIQTERELTEDEADTLEKLEAHIEGINEAIDTGNYVELAIETYDGDDVIEIPETIQRALQSDAMKKALNDILSEVAPELRSSRFAIAPIDREGVDLPDGYAFYYPEEDRIHLAPDFVAHIFQSEGVPFEDFAKWANSRGAWNLSDERREWIEGLSVAELKTFFRDTRNNPGARRSLPRKYDLDAIASGKEELEEMKATLVKAAIDYETGKASPAKNLWEKNDDQVRWREYYSSELRQLVLHENFHGVHFRRDGQFDSEEFTEVQKKVVEAIRSSRLFDNLIDDDAETFNDSDNYFRYLMSWMTAGGKPGSEAHKALMEDLGDEWEKYDIDSSIGAELFAEALTHAMMGRKFPGSDILLDYITDQQSNVRGGLNDLTERRAQRAPARRALDGPDLGVPPGPDTDKVTGWNRDRLDASVHRFISEDPFLPASDLIDGVHLGEGQKSLSTVVSETSVEDLTSLRDNLDALFKTGSLSDKSQSAEVSWQFIGTLDEIIELRGRDTSNLTPEEMEAYREELATFERALSEDVVGAVQAHWGSARSELFHWDFLADRVQTVLGEEYGVDVSHSESEPGAGWEDIWEVQTALEPFVDAWVRGQYSSTQKLLADKGITELNVYRGLYLPNRQDEDVDGASTRAPAWSSRGMESWSTDLEIALGFAGNKYGTADNTIDDMGDEELGEPTHILMHDVVPAEYILGMGDQNNRRNPSASIGEGEESEIVVLGSRRPVDQISNDFLKDFKRSRERATGAPPVADSGPDGPPPRPLTPEQEAEREAMWLAQQKREAERTVNFVMREDQLLDHLSSNPPSRIRSQDRAPGRSDDTAVPPVRQYTSEDLGLPEGAAPPPPRPLTPEQAAEREAMWQEQQRRDAVVTLSDIDGIDLATTAKTAQEWDVVTRASEDREARLAKVSTFLEERYPDKPWEEWKDKGLDLADLEQEELEDLLKKVWSIDVELEAGTHTVRLPDGTEREVRMTATPRQGSSRAIKKDDFDPDQPFTVAVDGYVDGTMEFDGRAHFERRYYDTETGELLGSQRAGDYHRAINITKETGEFTVYNNYMRNDDPIAFGEYTGDSPTGGGLAKELNYPAYAYYQSLNGNAVVEIGAAYAGTWIWPRQGAISPIDDSPARLAAFERLADISNSYVFGGPMPPDRRPSVSEGLAIALIAPTAEHRARYEALGALRDRGAVIDTRDVQLAIEAPVEGFDLDMVEVSRNAMINQKEALEMTDGMIEVLRANDTIGESFSRRWDGLDEEGRAKLAASIVNDLNSLFKDMGMRTTQTPISNMIDTGIR